MSIPRIALRLATRKALIGATYAGPRVFDSAITEIDLTVMETRKPLIIVTTDDEEGAVEAREITSADSQIDLVIEVAVAALVKTDAGGTELTIPDTDEGLEITVDLMCRQAIRALQSGTGEWADLWRSLVVNVTRITQRRGADARQGVRFAARQIVLTLQTINDPLAAPLNADPLGRFLTMAEADAEIAPIAALLRAEIGTPGPAWRLAAGTLGLDRIEADGIGVAPADDTEDGAPSLMLAGELGEGSGYDDEDDVAAQLPDPPDA